MTPDPLDQERQWASRELDQSRRTDPNPFTCQPGCGCRDEDAISTPLDKDDIE